MVKCLNIGKNIGRSLLASVCLIFILPAYSLSVVYPQNLREAQVFSLVAERRRKFQEIINRSNQEASQAVRPKSSSSRWLPPGSPPQLVTEILEIRESMLSLLVKLHEKLSAKQNSLSLSFLAEVDPAHHAHGDGLTAIERILAKASARSRHSKRCLQEICGKVCPPIPPKKNSPGDKKSMDKEERCVCVSRFIFVSFFVFFTLTRSIRIN